MRKGGAVFAYANSLFEIGMQAEKGVIESAISTMREGLKNAITGIIPELKDRLYDIQPPPVGAEEPYGVIAFGEEIWKSSWAGYRQVIRLKLYAGDAGLDQADAWARTLMEGLHHRRVEHAGEQAFTLHFLGSREAERVDASTGKACRAMRFGVYIPETGAGSMAVQPDEWLGALTEWSRQLLGDPWTVYHTTWPCGPSDYAVLWRLTGCTMKKAGASLYEVRKHFTGHIYAPDASSEQLSAMSLIEELGSKVQLPLGTDHKRYMSVVDVSANLEADAVLDGQLQLTLVQRRMRAPEEAALIRRVDIHPILK